MNSYAESLHYHSKILIVDDEPGIRRMLGDIFRDEGYLTVEVGSGEEALVASRKENPDLILLDIWMPGADGLEILKQLRAEHVDTPVIMMSGHATIATAVQATRMGAAEFVEKPLDLNVILEAVKKNLASSQAQDAAASTDKAITEEPQIETSAASSERRSPLKLNREVFQLEVCQGEFIAQKTVAKSAVLYGQGLHSGKKSGLILEPLPPHSGIHFVGVSETTPVPAHVSYVDSTSLATTVRLGDTHAATIEHLMSALCAYGITNVLIKCNGEVPGMDGSAIPFCDLIESAGVIDQGEPWATIRLPKAVSWGEGRERITYEPDHEGLTIEYTLKYPEPLGTQHYVFTFGDPEHYRQEIAPARTFVFLKDIAQLQKMGLALSGRVDSFVMVGEGNQGILNDRLRFSDEAVRHKILDAIGDLYLLGHRLSGKITAHLTGHSDNINLLKLVYQEICAGERSEQA